MKRNPKIEAAIRGDNAMNVAIRMTATAQAFRRAAASVAEFNLTWKETDRLNSLRRRSTHFGVPRWRRRVYRWQLFWHRQRVLRRRSKAAESRIAAMREP